MAGVTFIDTSVLLNLLDVPRNNADRVEDRAELARLQACGETLVLPITTIIETGNAIVRDGGGQRFTCAERFVEMLAKTLDGVWPWVASEVGLTHDVLRRIVVGHSGYPPLRELMTAGVGTGDASILVEVAQFRERIPRATPVRIWTHDRGLEAYA